MDEKNKIEAIERKRLWHDDHLAIICAFSNTNGGRLLLGLDEQGFHSGMIDGDYLLSNLPLKIFNHLGLVCQLELKTEQRGTHLEIKTAPSAIPIAYNGKYYQRSNNNNIELEGNKLERFLLTKSRKTWDESPEETASTNDIDFETVEIFQKMAMERFPKLRNIQSPWIIMETLGLLDGKKLKRAAILLFGKNPQKFYPGSYIRIGRFDEKENLLHENHVMGNLIQQMNTAYALLKDKYLTASVMEGLVRKNKLIYPDLVIREALVNAITHRVYPGSHSQIKVYPQSVHFWNDGALNKSLKLENLITTHPSKPRSRLISYVFFLAGMQDAWGTGSLVLIEEMKKQQLPKPVFKEESGGFLLSLYKDKWTEYLMNKLHLNDRQKAGIHYLKKNESITNKIYCELSTCSRKTASTDLGELVSKQMIANLGTKGVSSIYVLDY